MPLHPRRDGSTPAWTPRSAHRAIARQAWLAGVGTAGLLGVLAALADMQRSMAVAWLVIGAFGAATVSLVRCGTAPLDPRAVAAMVGEGLVGGIALLSTVAVVELSSTAALLVWGVLLLTSPWCVGRLAAWAARLLAPQPRMPTPDRMGDAELCRAWRASYAALLTARTPAQLASLAELRSRYLEELRRRDSLAFDAWMSSGAQAAGDPSAFFLDWSAAADDPPAA